MKNYFRTLNVSYTATSDEVTQSYRKLAMKFHPDRNQNNLDLSNSMMAEINEAYEILSNAESRSEYLIKFEKVNANLEINSKSSFFNPDDEAFTLHDYYRLINLELVKSKKYIFWSSVVFVISWVCIWMWKSNDVFALFVLVSYFSILVNFRNYLVYKYHISDFVSGVLAFFAFFIFTLGLIAIYVNYFKKS